MSKMAQIVVILLILASSFGLDGCNNEGNTTDNYEPAVNGSPQSNPSLMESPPMTTQFYKGYFTVSDEPIVNKTVDLSFNLETIENAPGTTVQFYLPRAVQLVSDNSTWTGDIEKGEKIVKTISVVVKEEGDWRLSVLVENSQYAGLNRFFYCYLNSYKNTGSLTDKPTTLPGPQLPATPITP